MNILIEYALSLGLTRAKIIQTNIIVVQNEVVERGCAACPSYGRYLSCPPAVPPPEIFRKYLNSFSKALLVQLIGGISGDQFAAGNKDAFKHFSILNKALLSLEEFCRANCFPRARCFIGGHCQLCDSCVGPGLECRKPVLLRSSIDANGINVVETCAGAGWPMKFPVTDSVSCTGLVLLE